VIEKGTVLLVVSRFRQHFSTIPPSDVRRAAGPGHFLRRGGGASLMSMMNPFVAAGGALGVEAGGRARVQPRDRRGARRFLHRRFDGVGVASEVGQLQDTRQTHEHNKGGCRFRGARC